MVFYRPVLPEAGEAIYSEIFLLFYQFIGKFTSKNSIEHIVLSENQYRVKKRKNTRCGK